MTASRLRRRVINSTWDQVQKHAVRPVPRPKGHFLSVGESHAWDSAESLLRNYGIPQGCVLGPNRILYL